MAFAQSAPFEFGPGPVEWPLPTMFATFDQLESVACIKRFIDVFGVIFPVRGYMKRTAGRKTVGAQLQK